jgi:hypothetical protein
MYRGLIRCNDCGLAITPEKHKGYVYYHCTEYNGKHGAKWLREEEITKQFNQIFQALKIPVDIVEQIIDTLTNVHKQKIEFHNTQFDKLMLEQKDLTKMMDNLYFDKLKGRISDEQYDKFYETFCIKKNDISMRLERLKEAEDNYYITSKYVLDIANRVYDLFLISEVEKKRLLIKLVLQNVRLDGKNIVYDAQKPFDMILNSADSKLWRPLVDAFLNGHVQFSFSLQHIQTTFSALNISVPRI